MSSRLLRRAGPRVSLPSNRRDSRTELCGPRRARGPRRPGPASTSSIGPSPFVPSGRTLSSSSSSLRVGVRVGAGGPSCSAAATESTSSYREKSLVTIEWPQLCQYVAGFAATSLGQRELCTNLHPPETERAALAMIRQTRAIQLMQEEYVAEIDFGGIQTLEAELALKRVTRGGMLNGGELLAGASLIRGTSK